MRTLVKKNVASIQNKMKEYKEKSIEKGKTKHPRQKKPEVSITDLSRNSYLESRPPKSKPNGKRPTMTLNLASSIRHIIE